MNFNFYHRCYNNLDALDFIVSMTVFIRWRHLIKIKYVIRLLFSNKILLISIFSIISINSSGATKNFSIVFKFKELVPVWQSLLVVYLYFCIYWIDYLCGLTDYFFFRHYISFRISEMWWRKFFPSEMVCSPFPVWSRQGSGMPVLVLLDYLLV